MLLVTDMFSCMFFFGGYIDNGYQKLLSSVWTLIYRHVFWMFLSWQHSGRAPFGKAIWKCSWDITLPISVARQGASMGIDRCQGYLALVEEWVANNKVPSRKMEKPHHCRSIMISLTCFFYKHGCWKHKHSQRSHVIKLFRQGLEGTRWLMIWCCVFH